MIRRIAAFLALTAMGTIDAHAATRSYPSLAKRPVESGEQVAQAKPAPAQIAASDPALVSNVATLQQQAVTADGAFQSELVKSRSSVTTATGTEPMSEAWVIAQMSITVADAARYDSVASLASLDTLSVERKDNADAGRVAADLATIDPARTHVLALVDAQNDALDGLKASLKNP